MVGHSFNAASNDKFRLVFCGDVKNGQSESWKLKLKAAILFVRDGETLHLFLILHSFKVLVFLS